MMKFKSLFRRGHHNHQSQQKHRQHPHSNSLNQQQVTPLTQASSSGLPHESLSSQRTTAEVPVTNATWLSTSSMPREALPMMVSTTKSTIRNERINETSLINDSCERMQNSDQENGFLQKEHFHIDLSSPGSTTCDERRYDDYFAEFALFKDRHNLELARLIKENEALRARLRDIPQSSVSDSEDQQSLNTTQPHNSVSASIQVNQDENNALMNLPQENAGNTDCGEWDKRSTMSEVSVTCLQDRILQMEETHYSTNEELQATIQELSDLQAQLSELQSDNERLNEEKGVLLESLCRQTEKLEDSRSKVDTLQELLLRDEQPQKSWKGYNTEREQKLVDLLKSAQEERESLLEKQEELTSELKNIRMTVEAITTEADSLAKRVKFLESTIEAVNVEKKVLDIELAESKQEGTNKSIEINRLATLLENAKAKIEELEQSRQLETKSEADAMLDAARKEKDTLETQAAALQEQLARSFCDHDRLRNQYSQLQEEYKVTRSNSKFVIEDLESRLSQVKEEKLSINTELQLVQESLSELQVQCQRHLEDKRELKAALSELQRREREAQTRLYELERVLTEERKLREQKNSEWEQFQSDLLMTVRIANDFKTEAQSELERVVLENKTQRDRLQVLEAQLDKLNDPGCQKDVIQQNSILPAKQTDTQHYVLTNVNQDGSKNRKFNISRQDSRLSVKCLIESIENSTKQAKSGPESRSSSTSSLNSIETSEVISLKAPLRDQQQISNLICPTNSTINNNKNQTPKGKKTFSESKPHGSVVLSPTQLLDTTTINTKTIDFVCKNSITDLSDRKDPLCGLVKNGGSRRNALLKWCQNKTIGYRNIDITNFSSSWNDGLALCAILHTYLPDKVPYDSLTPSEKRRNFSIAFSAAESVGIPTTLNIGEMCQLERPDWQQVMTYVTSIYKYFET